MRVCGPVTVSTDYKRTSAGGTTAASPANRTGPRLLVIGGGIAGITAAETARRVDPSSRISIVGRESYPLYNRMGISRVVYGRSAMQGLHLLPETWYDDQGIDSWLNTEVASLDLQEKVAHLATGEAVPFDRLILATGATPNRPSLHGGHLPGVAVLRTAEDAVRIRAYAQQCPAPDRRAVVAGAGLLGLEVAYALHQFGFAVTVLERNDRLMPKVIDATASAHLTEYLDLVGITLRTRAEVATAAGDGGVQQVTLTDGTALPAQLLVVCVGVRPELRLAAEAGLATRAGILVDDSMRTSHPEVFAAGDVAEHAGMLPGLWPVAVAQARIAGENAAGGASRYTPKPVVVLLKGVGISLVAAGRIEPGPGEHAVCFEGPGTHAYLRVVRREDVVVGALSLARPEDVQLLPDGIGLTQRQFLDRLRVEETAVRVSPLAAVDAAM
jgi:NAD(P)H-nitrite reductase large subunit